MAKSNARQVELFSCPTFTLPLIGVVRGYMVRSDEEWTYVLLTGERGAKMNLNREKLVSGERPNLLLTTLEHLLAIEAIEMKAALDQAAQLITETLYAEKVDVFLYDPSKNSLMALGTSDTSMGRHQKALGLDLLQIANGGRLVGIFLTGEPFITGQADQDSEELAGIRHPEPEGLGVVSEIGAAFEINGERRGILMASSRMPNFFTEQDLRFLEAAARWIGMITHRAELIEQQTKEAVEQSRRITAEELLTIMAHDLRNYLTPLKARLNLMERRAHREDRAADLRDVKSATSTLERLDQLIRNLLDVARLDQGIFAINHQPINLVALIQDLVPAFSTPQTQIHVLIDHEVELSADPDRLHQIFENLLANAVKHALKGTPVEVRIEKEQRGDRIWGIVTVSNQGATIPPDLLDHLFQPFITGSDSQGLGLGLYLARNIAEAHQGQLSVNASAGAVHFTLCLPIDKEYGTGNTSPLV